MHAPVTAGQEEHPDFDPACLVKHAAATRKEVVQGTPKRRKVQPACRGHTMSNLLQMTDEFSDAPIMPPKSGPFIAALPMPSSQSTQCSVHGFLAGRGELRFVPVMPVLALMSRAELSMADRQSKWKALSKDVVKAREKDNRQAHITV